MVGLRRGGLAHPTGLSKTIPLDLSAATPRELFDAICKPIGARFVIDGEMVKILAK